MKIDCLQLKPLDVVKEVYWLAWKACGGPMGFGILRNLPTANKEDVFNNVCNAGDYPCNTNNIENEFYADYVFGRMMKFGMGISDNSIIISDEIPTIDYQSWRKVYPTFKSLVEKAIENLNE